MRIFTFCIHRKLLYILSLALFYFIFYRILISRMNAFGCFDDCFNYVGGYFVNNGKRIYTDFFFNHQPLMAYISAFIQNFTHSDSIPLLLLRHRQALFLFGFIFSSVITIRFGYIGVLFAFLYESSKYYLFGDRFLAEGFITYPLVYMVLVLLHKRNIAWIDSFIVTISTWFIVFMREPYIPISLLIYIGYIISDNHNTRKNISVLLFVVLCIIPFSYIRFHDYIFNVVTVNAKTVFIADINTTGLFGIGGLKIFFYPFYILLASGEWNAFRIFLGILSVLLIIASIYGVLDTTKRKKIFLVWILLAVSNLRFSLPGQMFYSAFHMLPWYSMFLVSVIFLVSQIPLWKTKYKLLFVTVIFVSFGSGLLFQSKSYIYENVKPLDELLVNYGKILNVSTVIKTITKSTDDVFIDGADELLYFASGRLSKYRYSWYTSVMPSFDKYRSARIEMFNTKPPDIYYRYCSEEILPQYFLPEKIRGSYTTLYYDGKPSCLYVRTAYAKSVSDSQWQEAANLGYSYNK